MPSNVRRRSNISPRNKTSTAHGPLYRLRWFPAAVAVLLAIPCFTLPFLWDDFDFLARAEAFHLRDFLPDRSESLYRPISRDAYFGLVELVGRGSPFIAHLMNVAIAAACTVLLVSLIRKLSNPRSALIGGLIFSAAAAIPLLVGWISGSQDLLCILFALGAYLLFLRGRVVLGSATFAAAILSKETAVALVPAMLVLAMKPNREGRKRVLRTAFGLGLVLCGWAALHPWVARVLVHHEVSRVNDYVAFRGVGTLFGLARGLPALLNLSWTGEYKWDAGIIACGLLASVATVMIIRRAWQFAPDRNDVEAPRGERLLMTAGLLTFLGPLILTSAFIAHWSLYYAAISSVGLAMIAAPALSRASLPFASLAVLAFLGTGVVSRMAVLEPEVPAEHNLSETANAMKRIERELKTLEPILPHGAHVYLYIESPGAYGAYDSMYKNQPLKVWYKDASIEVRDPMHLLPSTSEEFLFWISSRIDVFEVDPHTLQAHSPGPGASFPEYQKTLRAFALGLAGRGEIDRAVSILTGMLQSSDYLKAYDHCTAAALLYSVGRDQEANRIVTSTSLFHRSDALGEIAGLVAKPIPGIDLDEGALRAFGIAPTDTSAVREIMRSLEKRGFRESAGRFARRLLLLVPTDSEAARLVSKESTPGT